MKKVINKTNKEMHNLKDIQCYICGSKKITAYIYFNVENMPMVSFDCAECTEHDLPTPICGLEITPKSLKFLVGAEDMLK